MLDALSVPVERRLVLFPPKLSVELAACFHVEPAALPVIPPVPVVVTVPLFVNTVVAVLNAIVSANVIFAVEETDVRGILRGGGSDADIAAAIRENVRQKWLGHQINTQQFVPPPRPMYSIGG